jgi:hypothetical protein
MSNTCVACGTTRKKKQLVYSEDFTPYCSSYWICNDNHPHYPTKENKIPLFSLSDMQEKLREELGEDSDYLKQLKLKPFSVRISDYRTISFLIDIKKAYNLDSFSDCLRYCIDFTMKEKQKELGQETETKTVITKTTSEELTF